MTRRIRPYASAACVALACSIAAAACSNDSAGAADAGPIVPAAPDVKCPADIPEFTANPTSGIEATVVKHKTLRARVISADPVHPKKKVRNDWVVQFTDDSGAALDDVELADACAFMPPPHNHGGRPLEGKHALAQRGQFEIDYINFFMGGPWHIEMVVNRHKSDASDTDGGTSKDADGGAPVPAMEVTDCVPRHAPGEELVVFDVCVAD